MSCTDFCRRCLYQTIISIKNYMMAWINWLDLLSVIWSLVSSTMTEFLIDHKWSKQDYALTNTVRKWFASLKILSHSNLDSQW